jgi:hypothetical protein
MPFGPYGPIDHDPRGAAWACRSQLHSQGALDQVSVGQWVIACLWLAGIMTLIMLVLLLVALADPARRGRTRDRSSPRRN